MTKFLLIAFMATSAFSAETIITCSNSEEKIVLFVNESNPTSHYVEVYGQAGLGPNGLIESYVSNSKKNVFRKVAKDVVTETNITFPKSTLNIDTTLKVPAKFGKISYQKCTIE